ncbi:MAG: peptidoglycan editing factor PgeF [Simkaniaceae bacterium]|nr:peptidoglycan editing factor PgeF [Candidatus Sacchlamyda saccharinae]
MIRCKKENLEWLEFELLQPHLGVKHGVFTRNTDLTLIPNICSPRQVHGAHVEIAPFEGECDGLITLEPGVSLLIRHADCQAAIFYDPVKKAIANVHCGWRGSVQNIYANTVQKLVELGCRPKDLLVCISPSLGPEKAEFINHKTELPESFLPFQVKENHFDFWQISKWQLKEAGVLEKNIEIARICTFCEEKDFFSYRRDKKTGRNGTVIALSKV